MGGKNRWLILLKNPITINMTLMTLILNDETTSPMTLNLWIIITSLAVCVPLDELLPSIPNFKHQRLISLSPPQASSK